MTDNNHADFESDLHEEYPTLKPAPDMTREEFLSKARDLLDELEEDHEEQTGVSASEPHDWDYWVGELTAAYVNS